MGIPTGFAAGVAGMGTVSDFPTCSSTAPVMGYHLPATAWEPRLPLTRLFCFVLSPHAHLQYALAPSLKHAAFTLAPPHSCTAQLLSGLCLLTLASLTLFATALTLALSLALASHLLSCTVPHATFGKPPPSTLLSR